MEKEDHGNGLVTTPDYWDCECDDNYIHPKSEEKCEKCGKKPDEQPDSRVNEVEDMLAQKKILGKVDAETAIKIAADWLLNDADLDEAAHVVGLISGTKLFAERNGHVDVWIVENDNENNYCGIFDEVMEK